jgi:uracil-DNA glycosylase
VRRVLFIGQAPARPSSNHEVPGTYLHPWLRSIDLSDSAIHEYCHFDALIASYPGASKNGHKPPSKEQVKQYRPILIQHIRSIQPDVVVPVGKMAICELLSQDNITLESTVGTLHLIDPFDSLNRKIPCIALSHPSGRSAWNHIHKQQVQHALQRLRHILFLDE